MYYNDAHDKAVEEATAHAASLQRIGVNAYVQINNDYCDEHYDSVQVRTSKVVLVYYNVVEDKQQTQDYSVQVSYKQLDSYVARH